MSEVLGLVNVGASVSGHVGESGEIHGIINEAWNISGTVGSVLSVTGDITSVRSITGTVTFPVSASPSGDSYDGPYRVAPTQQDQVLPIAGKWALHDITVEKIPSNYGLITWDGSKLTVS